MMYPVRAPSEVFQKKRQYSPSHSFPPDGLAHQAGSVILGKACNCEVQSCTLQLAPHAVMEQLRGGRLRGERGWAARGREEAARVTPWNWRAVDLGDENV